MHYYKPITHGSVIKLKYFRAFSEYIETFLWIIAITFCKQKKKKMEKNRENGFKHNL